MNDLARPVMGTIFLVVKKGISNYIIGRAKRAPHWGVQSRFRVIGRAKRAPLWDVQSRFRVICICYSTGRSDIRDIFHEL